MPRAIKRAVSAVDWVSSELAFASDFNPNIECTPWVEAYEPQSENDLVIHRDKLRELSVTIRELFTGSQVRSSGGPILVLTGPSGCGKTATVKVLLRATTVKDRKPVQIIEWNDDSLEADDFTQLEQFVSQVSRFGPTIRGSDVPELEDLPFAILLENLPVSTANNIPRFHRLLRNHHSRGQTRGLLVLMFTSNSSSKEGLLNERLLCPASLRSELGVARVEFNSVAPTLVLKALTRILLNREIKQMGKGAPPRLLLQQLSNECAGDLRTAINQLQFLAKSGWKNQGAHSQVLNSCFRDAGLLLFRVLGKILYGKRQETHVKRHTRNVAIESPSLPSHLEQWKRFPLSFDVEEILDQCQVDGDSLVSWLHENYLDFTPHMNATNWSSDGLSWSDAFLSGGMNWRLGLTAAADWNSDRSSGGNTTTGASRHYAALVTSRTLLLAHDMQDRDSGGRSKIPRVNQSRGFHPFRSPTLQTYWRSATDKLDCVVDILRNRYHTSDVHLASKVISGRRNLLLDLISLGLKTPILKSVLSSEDFCLFSGFCAFRKTTSLSKPPTADRINKLAKMDVDNGDQTCWMCPQDAALEGESLPIEEDDSDESGGRGR
ncbi:hypothetical protein CRM22_008939 [Opisthorchis felineus]|uniref:AAA+ ATPase domain-containing protein n=1 Tax=Opisthorchis felineus TaxID=147828 RepID=A0A4S2L9P9_OPIFE|nr:hypothetical protein CRM22_008939 [Opisthorchis felineus]